MAKKRAPSRNGKTYWLCQCDCGQEKEIQTCHLTSGAISSCGCKKIAANGDIKKCPICGKDFQVNNYTAATAAPNVIGVSIATISK